MKMDRTFLFSFIFILSVFISSISQILLKKSAMHKYKSKIQEYLNPIVTISYIMFFSCTFITIIAYRYIPLSWGPILESSGYIFISIMSYLFLKENFTKKNLVGMIVIILGIIVFSN